MSDFNSWDEVKDWLLQDECVFYWAWTYSKDWMTCGDFECGCEDDFDNVDDAIKQLRERCSDRLHMVKKL